MEETCRGNRTIVIVYLLPPGIPAGNQETIDRLCRQTEAESRIEPTYKIVYIPVPFKESIAKYLNIDETKNSTPCDGLIIYARTQGNADVFLNMQLNIVSFCIRVQNFKNTVIFIDSGKTNSVSKHIPVQFKKNNVTGVTCLNIQVKHNFIKTYLYGDHILLFVPERIYSQPAVSLVCSWWFEYYVGKIFSCGTGRLIQYSGTCYLNAAVNGIILSENVSSMVLMYMNMAIEADRTGQLKGLIQQGVQIGECPRSFKEVLFLYRIMYSVYCTDVRGDNVLRRRALPREIIGDYRKDYLLSGDEWYTETLYPVIAPSELIKTNGGVTFFALYQMFSNMSVQFVVKYTDGSFRAPQLYDLRYPDPQDPVGRRHRQDEFYPFIHGLNTALNSYVRKCDIILEFFPSKDDNRIEMTITVPDDPNSNFDLQFGTITLGGDISHSIVGYFCNGKPQTYDSANNKINFSNWTALNNPEVKAGLLQDMSSYFSAHVTEAYISSCVYLNRNKIPEYTRLGRCPV